MADWSWEIYPDDLLDGLPPEVIADVEHMAQQIATRESMIFLDGSAYTGLGPGLRDEYRGKLVVWYMTDVRSEKIVIVRVAWMG